MENPWQSSRAMRVLGFMTGTSLDAVDMAIVETDGEDITGLGPAGEKKLDPAARTLVERAVSDALRLKAEHDRRLRGMDDFIAAYEAEHGVITDEEMDAAYRRAKARAIVVRGGRVVDDKGTGAA